MFPVEIMAIEFRGMSIITATFVIFMSMGCVAAYKLFKQEIERIDTVIDHTVTEINSKISNTNEEVSLLFEKYDQTNRDLTEIKTDVARTREAVEWIKRAMEHKTR